MSAATHAFFIGMTMDNKKIDAILRLRYVTNCNYKTAVEYLTKSDWRVVEAICLMIDEDKVNPEWLYWHQLKAGLHLISNFYFPQTFYCGEQNGEIIWGNFAVARKYSTKKEALAIMGTLTYHMPLTVESV